MQTRGVSEKDQSAPDQRETSSLRAGAGESKGAVVISTNGLPDGYVPPSAALMPGTPSAASSATTGDAAPAPIDDGS